MNRTGVSETQAAELLAEVLALRCQLQQLEAEQAASDRVLSAFQRSQAELERLFSLSLEMLCIAGVDGYFKRVNPAFERTLGYGCEELLARPFIEFVHPDDREKTTAELESLSQGRPTVRFVNRYRTKDGTYRWLQWMAMPQQEDGLIYASAHDITERRRSDQWVRTILEMAPDAMVVTDGSGRIILVNAQTERVFGYRRDELLGQSVEMLVPERFRQRHAQDRGGYMAGPEARMMGSRPDLPARRKDGSELVAEIALTPIRTEEGVLVFSVIRDVTERRRVEKALRENEAQLTVARKIQEYFLPRAAPALAGFDIAGASYPAEFTAGDHFDYLPMAGSTMGIVIGDVSGHGFGPALLMVSLRNHLRALVEHHDELDEILSDANRLLSGELGDEHFITAIMGRLDPKERTFRYLNAGHPAGYLLDPSGQVKASLESTIVPLGIMPDIAFPPAKTLGLLPGDLLFLLTDGVIEAHNRHREAFGANRALDVVRVNRHRPAREIIEALHQEVLEYSDGKRLADDLTVVLVKVES